MDGVMACAGDCDDADATSFPGNPEVCDGADNDCDPATDEGVDADLDGYSLCEGDCDDAEILATPAGAEVCDGLDNDCDGTADDDCLTCTGWVPTDWTTPAVAVASAPSGAVVCVEPGAWIGPFAYGGAAVHLLGVAGPPATVLDAWNAATTVTFAGGEGPDSILQGFTVTGGVGSNGGGIFVSGASPTLLDLVVTGNYATGGGGGLCLFGSSGATLNDVVVTGNDTAGDGGGLYIGPYDGSTMDNVVVVDNEADYAGGGLYIRDYSTPTFTNLVVADNVAGGGGGGINLWSHANPTITGFLVTGNSTVSGEYGGGLLADNDSWPVFNQGVFAGNAGIGGAIYTWGQSLVQLNGVTITANYGYPGGFGSGGGGGWFDHCNLWGNFSPDTSNVSYPDGVDGNISEPPGFLVGVNMATDSIGWDLHLATTSLLMDAGGGVDLDGSVRDIGAYGGPTALGFDRDLDGWYDWWLPGPFDASTSPGADCDDNDPTVYPGNGC